MVDEMCQILADIGRYCVIYDLGHPGRAGGVSYNLVKNPELGSGCLAPQHSQERPPWRGSGPRDPGASSEAPKQMVKLRC